MYFAIIDVVTTFIIYKKTNFLKIIKFICNFEIKNNIFQMQNYVIKINRFVMIIQNN